MTIQRLRIGCRLQLIAASMVVAAICGGGCAGKPSVVASGGVGQPTAGVGGPVKPAAQASADMSTPRSTLKAFATAIENGDMPAVRAVTITDDKTVKLLEAVVPMMGSFKRLSAASVKRFGEAGKSIGGDSKPGVQISADIDKAEITETGDTATAKSPKSKQPLKLKRIDGNWKVDFASAMGDQAKAEDVAKVVPMFTGLSNAASEAASEIDAGKYKTAEEAKTAVGMKMMGAVFGGMADLMKDAAKKGGQANPFGGMPGGSSQVNPFGGMPGGSSQVNPFGGMPGGSSPVNPFAGSGGSGGAGKQP